MDNFETFRLAHSMRFIRSIILASIVLHVFFSLIGQFTGTYPGTEINILRFGMILFSLSMYAVTFTKLFQEYTNYFLALLIFVNSMGFLALGVLAGGIDAVNQTSLMQRAMIMLMINYILPMGFKSASVNGILISIPFMLVALISGNIEHILTTFMMLSILNLLMSINSHSNEEMMKKLWTYNRENKIHEVYENG